MTSLTDWISGNIPDVVMDDAAAWMAVLDSERCNEADRLSFARWLDEAPSHRWAFEELSEVWARLHILSDVEPLLAQDKVVAFPGTGGRAAPLPTRHSTQPKRGDWSALVASLIVVAGVVAHLAFSAPSEDFVTDVGEARDVVLSDGSMLELNAMTSMTVTLNDNRRSVKLLDGEAVFHVAKDDRPFIVDTEFGTVAALGTSFNVEVINGALEVSVIEGIVAVTTSGDPPPLTEFEGDSKIQFARDATVLGAGDWLEVSGSSHRQRVLGTEEFRKRLSWRNGIVEFEQQPLHSVVQEMRRYTRTSIHVADSELNSLRVTGRFETGNVMHFLTQLNEKYRIVVDSVNADWILLRSGPVTDSK